VSTPPDTFPEEESKTSNSVAEEHVIPDAGQTIENTEPGEHPQASPGLSTSTLPPETQGEANGGPLGCCLGVIIGLLLSLSVAVLSRFYADPLAHIFSSWLSLIIRIVMILIAIVAIIVCGYFGWKIGQNAYREYEIPAAKERRRRKTQRSPLSRP
jgi:hypothetical protein